MRALTTDETMGLGYRIFKRLEDPGWLSVANELHQKRVRDESGATLYFIELWYHVSGDVHVFQPKVQFSMPNDRKTNIALLGEYTIAEMEAEFSRLYAALGAIPYDN